MTQKIKIKRGLSANLPALADGELAFCTDTSELFVGSHIGNLLLLSASEAVPPIIDGGSFTGSPLSSSFDGGSFV
jgi:hypothetical protein